MKPRILIVDDEVRMQRLFEINLSPKYRVLTSGGGEEALAMKMPGMDGMALLQEVRRAYPDLPIIIMTAYGTVEGAVQAMKEGAVDYILKPIKMEEMELLIEKTLSVRNLQDENRSLRQELQKVYGPANIVGNHPAMQKIIQLISQVSTTKATVLIQGESGTGKEIVARAIHYRSDRASRPFVVINCAAIPGNLLESELFGYEKGAFTGAIKTKRGRLELADQGTLFLDEIGEMPKELQVKILRVLEEQKFQRVGGTEEVEVDNRIIAATNKDLKQAVEAGSFRDDLFYRLNVFALSIPPLRQRKEDIPLLVDYFLKKHREVFKSRAAGVSEDVLKILMNYPWPGNVRELEHTIERILILEDGELIQPEHLPSFISGRQGDFQVFSDGELTMEELERRYLQFILRRTKGNQSEAARILGINRKTLGQKIQKYNLRTSF
jgi:DNA-binding NtrC family response regulator